MSNYRPVSMDDDSSNSDSLSINELDLLNERKYEDLNRHARIRALPSNFPLRSTASMLAWKIVRLGIYFSRSLIETRRFLLGLKAWIRANLKRFTAICIGVILFALACATPAILGVIGFYPMGPVAGSIAAAWQASIGSVAPGTLFAFLQSTAMGGSIWWFNMIGYVGVLIAVAGIVGTVDFREKVAEIGEIIYENSVNAGEVIKDRAVAVGGAMAIGAIKVGIKVEGWWGKIKGKMKGE